MAKYTKNELIIIDTLKKSNKAFLDLIKTPIDNITIGSGARADKGLSTGFSVNPDFIIHLLLAYMTTTDSSGYSPVFSNTKTISSEELNEIQQWIINNYFFLVCVDKLITHYSLSPVYGYSTFDTKKESWSDFKTTCFILESDSGKRLRVKIMPSSRELIKTMDLRGFRTTALFKISIQKDDGSAELLVYAYSSFKALPNTIEELVKQADKKLV